jgi:hypothetical protein
MGRSAASADPQPRTMAVTLAVAIQADVDFILIP